MATMMAPAKPPETRAEVARTPARELAPFDLMRQWTREMDHFFTDFFGHRTLPRVWRTPEVAAWVPDLEMRDADGMLTVRADLPGLASTDVKVEILDGVLTITGERKQEKEEKAEGYFVSERSYGHFERRVTLPEGVKDDAANASFKDGVLEVKMPHPLPAARTPREVPVA